jgi:hypothetical protein
MIPFLRSNFLFTLFSDDKKETSWIMINVNNAAQRLLLFRLLGWIIATRSIVVAHVLALSSTPSSTNTKLEKAAIARFNNNYDKLCKTCPALLKPKVDTLTEMILGLSSEEREQLFSTVALRLQQQQQQHPQQYPRGDGKDVTQFAAVKLAEDDSKVLAYSVEVAPKITVIGTTQKDNEKWRVKMDKLRSKFESNKYKVSQVQALLEQTNRLLISKQAYDDDGDGVYYDSITQITDPTVLHKTLEMQSMTRSELEMQRLKCTAQKMKLEQKMAKAKLKLYQASLRGTVTMMD